MTETENELLNKLLNVYADLKKQNQYVIERLDAMDKVQSLTNDLVEKQSQRAEAQSEQIKICIQELFPDIDITGLGKEAKAESDYQERKAKLQVVK